MSAPIRAKEVLRLLRAPLKVSFALNAESPNALSMAAEKVSKSILPLVVISRTSASVVFKYFANSAAAFNPREDKRSKSSPISRPWPATLVKTSATSVKLDPDIAAVPAIALRVPSIFSRGTLEAAKLPAALAAASREYAVPVTAESAIDNICLASSPKPSNMKFACSRLRAL